MWWQVDRPSLFVKVPAARQGLPAISACLAEGISINLTLIFSLAEVIEAFLTGLERARAVGAGPGRRARGSAPGSPCTSACAPQANSPRTGSPPGSSALYTVKPLDQATLAAAAEATGGGWSSPRTTSPGWPRRRRARCAGRVRAAAAGPAMRGERAARLGTPDELMEAAGVPAPRIAAAARMLVTG